MSVLTPTAIHAYMSTLEEDAPSYPTVKGWVMEFKRGRESLEHDSRSVRPSTDTCHTANTMGISHERVQNILRNELDKGFSMLGSKVSDSL